MVIPSCSWPSAFFVFFAFGLTLSLLPLFHPDINARFLRYVSGISLAFLGTAVALSWPVGHGGSSFGLGPLLIPLMIADVFVLVLAGNTPGRRHLGLLVFCLLVVVSGILIYILKELSADHPGAEALSWLLPPLFLLSGGAVVGIALTAMLLGHSYLVHADLSFEYLIRISKFFIGSILFKVAVVGVALVAFVGVGDLWPRLQRQMQADLLVGLMPIVRVLVGLVFPLILGFMVLSCAKIRSNQSATGIMYVATGFVIIGELCSFFLMFNTPFPL